MKCQLTSCMCKYIDTMTVTYTAQNAVVLQYLLRGDASVAKVVQLVLETFQVPGGL